ncbi:transketolase [Sphingomonas jejuensis]|uniref:Transketolase n=1 Tax=Sphingomonas jejuensis TaxID=904715 RepID=A0ABX0XIK3_9SPHN|nr:transketolase [Sphingomonas jejuensis]NJC33161.1 transketolase [Sphingomonas jejuensis]
MTVAPTDLANAVRVLSMDGVEAANSGHPGMPMGMADAATVLWTRHLKFDAADPYWPDRDRFVLSAGHGSMLIYALLHLSGFARPTIEDVRSFRQVGSPCAGHPENFELPGVECTTGPLGQGLAMAVGMAIAERHLMATFGAELVDHHTWVIAGDGCLMEGINHEAIGLAGHLGLGRLNVLWDDNRITIDGAVSLSSSEDIPARYRATGWHVVECDGHDMEDVDRALSEAKADPRPTLIRCTTVIGKGAPGKEGTSAVHGAALGPDIVAKTREAVGWPHEAFVIPEAIADSWRQVGAQGAAAREAWQGRLSGHPLQAEFERRMAGDVDLPVEAVSADLATKPQATRKSSEAVLGGLAAALPEMVGGSADLTGSNNTKTKAMTPLTRDDYAGRYIYYGIREFGMSAAMNGMALHGGIIPFGGTFLVFADYARAAIRLSALQRARVVYVMTHDSIGLGEDGPTHQPIEHLLSLRAIPNLDVWRPCDAVETAEAWALSVARKDGPSLLALSRQDLPQFRSDAGEMKSAKGAYRLRAAAAPRRVILIATGSEVALAVSVAERLEADGIGADVVSMPSWERFDAQPQAYRDDILPNVDPSEIMRVSIEAGTTLGWERYTMVNGLRFGIDSFGASGPAPAVYDHFGLTADNIAAKVKAAL